MDVLQSARERIGELDLDLMKKAQDRLDHLTKPQGSLGRLEELARLLVGITRRETPSVEKKVIFTLAADHGVTEEGTSAYPKEVTAQMVRNFLRGGAGINVLAHHAGARVVVADMGVAGDLGSCPGLIVRKVAHGTKNMARGPAMSRCEALQAVEAGVGIFEDAYADGIDIAGTGDMGIGNTTAASAITAAITRASATEVTGRGTGIDDAALANKIRVIERALSVNAPDPDDAIDVLAKVGGFEIGGLAGIILAACARRVPIVIDGFISGAAALIAFRIEPRTKDFMIASHCSVERGHTIILQKIGLRPLLDLGLRLGEGTGAALAMTLIDASIQVMTRMSSFTEANVSERAGG